MYRRSSIFASFYGLVRKQSAFVLYKCACFVPSARYDHENRAFLVMSSRLCPCTLCQGAVLQSSYKIKQHTKLYGFWYAKNSIEGPSTAKKSKLLKAIRVRVTQVAVTKRSMLLKTHRTRLKITLIIDLINIVLAMIWCFQQVTKTNQHRLRYMRVAGKAAQVPFLSAVDPHKFIVNAPINVNPVRGGGECGQRVGIWPRNPSPQWEVWSTTFARGSGHLLCWAQRLRPR